LLKQQLIAHAPRGFAGAAFLGTEHGKVDMSSFQQLDDAA